MVSLINSELIFCQWHQVELQFHFYACEYSIFPATFISRNLLLKDQVAQLVKKIHLNAKPCSTPGWEDPLEKG